MDNKQCNSVPSPGSFMFAQWLWSTLSLPCLFSNVVGGGSGGRSLNTKNRKASIESDTVPPWGGLLVFHTSPLRRGAPPTAAESQGSKSCQVNISSQDYSKKGGWSRAEMKELRNSISLTETSLLPHMFAHMADRTIHNTHSSFSFLHL